MKIKTVSKGIQPEQLLAKNGAELGEQSAIMCWCGQQQQVYPELRWLFHVPNGGARDAITAGQMKASGVKKGVVDLWLPLRKGNFIGLVIEMKRRDGVPSDVSNEQIEWLTHLQEQGWKCVVAYGYVQARNTLLYYLNLPTKKDQANG